MDKHRILIIDDDKDICTVLKTALNQTYEVVTANDGYDGLQKVQALEPDLVILDIKMPKVDGHHLCDSIKRNRKTKETTVIFMSGYGSDEEELAAFQEGAALFIRKPFDLPNVINQIQGILSKITPRDKTLSYEDIQHMM